MSISAYVCVCVLDVTMLQLALHEHLKTVFIVPIEPYVVQTSSKVNHNHFFDKTNCLNPKKHPSSLILSRTYVFEYAAQWLALALL